MIVVLYVWRRVALSLFWWVVWPYIYFSNAHLRLKVGNNFLLRRRCALIEFYNDMVSQWFSAIHWRVALAGKLATFPFEFPLPSRQVQGREKDKLVQLLRPLTCPRHFKRSNKIAVRRQVLYRQKTSGRSWNDGRAAITEQSIESKSITLSRLSISDWASV